MKQKDSSKTNKKIIIFGLLSVFIAWINYAVKLANP